MYVGWSVLIFRSIGGFTLLIESRYKINKNKPLQIYYYSESLAYLTEIEGALSVPWSP